jgi:hemin uptake protein HemP
VQQLDCASIELYKQLVGNIGGTTAIMTAPSGDNVGGAGKHAENPPSATRLLTMNGSRIDSRELFATEREIIIAHGGDNYRLRLTSQNKLILTK